MSLQRSCTMSMEDDAILRVQLLQHREVAELRWDGATELIRVEAPERATMAQWTIEDASYSQIIPIVIRDYKKHIIKSEVIHIAYGDDAILSAQIGELREVAKLKWDGASEIIRLEPPDSATLTQWEQLKMHRIHRLSQWGQIREYNNHIMSIQRSDTMSMEDDAILIVQLLQHREVA